MQAPATGTSGAADSATSSLPAFLTPAAPVSTAGGTSSPGGQAVVVLAPAQPVSDAVLKQIVTVLRVRTARMAGGSDTITSANGQITVTGTADQAAQLKALAGQGTLLLRPVLGDKTPLPTPSGAAEKKAEDAFGALDCTWSDPTKPLAAAGDYLAACAQSSGSYVGIQKYLMGPAAVSGKDVSSVQASQSNGTWEVDISLDDAGASAMATLSATAAAGQDSDGTNRFAIVLDDVVYEAPTVTSTITDGQLQLSGTNQTFANQDAAVWSVGAMPLRLVSSSVSGG
ncbi:preprotein translocase subunit SecD [Catenulispora sp. GAS73]|uniref:SecDF P1 head subdomain-containing protein n=1 Tax=Catenulispora sp. GAS73 TaxID=3156269 RepID=UPI003511B02A